MWNALEHSNEENQRWCYLRAVEWGRWPVFLSQTLAPVLLLFFSWQQVVLGTFLCNLAWSLVRYNFVSVNLAFIGALVVYLRWPVCLGMAIYFLTVPDVPKALVAGLWPFLIFVIGLLPTTRVGKLQSIFMAKLGYYRLFNFFA